MKPKMLIFLLIVLVLLFFLGFGLTSSCISTGWFSGALDMENKGWGRIVQNWLTQDLPPDEIINMWPGECRPNETRFMIRPAEVCTATILGSDMGTRQLSLQLIQGDAVTVNLVQENALSVEMIIERHPELEVTPTPLDIYKNADLHNATLTLQDCLSKEATGDDDNEERRPPPNCVLELR